MYVTPEYFRIILCFTKLHFSLFMPSVSPLGCVEADDVLQKCEHVLESLDQLDEQLFSEWTVGLEEICQSHLNEPLLMLDSDTGRFYVNFSPAVSTPKKQATFLKKATTVEQTQVFCNQLTSVLREVKYLDMLKTLNIPKVAVQLHSQQGRLYVVSF